MNLTNILEHMNRDHKVSLYDYLAYYGDVKLSIDNPKNSVELINIELDKLTLNYNSRGVLKSIVIPLEPPMSSFSEARNRFISMAFEAARGLKVSPYRITTFKPPTGTRRVFFGALLGIVAALGLTSYNKWVATQLLGPRNPLLRWIKTIFWATLLVHVVEYSNLVNPLLRFHRVPPRVRMQYLFATLLVGYPGWLSLRDEARTLAQRQLEHEKSN